MTTVAFTADFHEAFDQQTSQILRARFLLFTGLFAGLSAVWLAFLLVFFVALPMTGAAEGEPVTSGTIIAMVQRGLDVLCYATTFAYAWRRPLRDVQLVKLSLFIIMADGLYSLILAAAASGWGGTQVWTLLLPHVIAAACLPWTFGQALRPLLPVLGLNAILAIGAGLMATSPAPSQGLSVPASTVASPSTAVPASADLDAKGQPSPAAAPLPSAATEATPPTSPAALPPAPAPAASLPPGPRWGLKWTAIGLSLLVPVPGIIIASLKHDSRVRSFKVQFLESRYGQIRRELTDARKIHESLFPRAEARGSLRFDYRYQPMRLIGGDYLYARFHEPKSEGDDPPLTLLLMDVTGHGVAAALTVNRLYGEVERLFGENPEIRPGEVVRALNRYVYHTLANHALYVTAVCVRIDPATDALEFASAGHPPGFLRAVDGTIDELPSTTFLLGAVKDDEFDPAPQTRPFVRGDTLILYTDGAMEAASATGHQFGLVGLQRAIASCQGLGLGEWSAMLLTAVDRHRSGPPSDDTLVVEIARLIVSAEGEGAAISQPRVAGTRRG
jgi:serine phosphatase RsbU (regulator of sigma subunit)